jgi:CDP-glycerol glycerophosphotransferase
MAARVSVVVPIYNVAAYLDACLESLAAQTLRNLEVVMVDDGSTDESPQIAERYAAADERFKLVRQENAGLGAARNMGADHATGEFIAFVDSDDTVTPNAYELLLSTLDETGSDFASGNALRRMAFGTTPVAFLSQAFERTRLRTHITRFPPLRVDRTAWNKLFRRSFWDEHGFRFPEGVLYEDIPVTLPAHYVARSVDIREEPVYLWRQREGSDRSITQKRTEPKALRDRVAAVDHVSRFLAARGMIVSKALYDRSVLRHDLRYFLAVLPSVGDGYRELFLELVNDFLDRAHYSTTGQLFAIDRLLWELVRRRALPELLEALRFEADDLQGTPPVREGRRWYGDYPFRGDERLALPDDVYRLRDELGPIARVERMGWDGDTLRLAGYAYVDLIGAPSPGSQRLTLMAVRGGFPPKRVRLDVEEVHRPDLTATTKQQLVSLDYAGFEATLDGSELRQGGAWRPGSWELRVSIEAQGVRRRTTRLDQAPLCPVPAAELAPAEGIRVHAAVGRGGELRVRVVQQRELVPTVRIEDAVVELEGELRGSARGPLSLEVGVPGEVLLTYPAHVDRSRPRPAFLARVPVADLAGGSTLELVNGARRIPLRLPEVSLDVAEPKGPAVVTGAEISADRGLGLSGRLGGQLELGELIVAGLGIPRSFAVPLEVEEDRRFSVAVKPGGVKPGGMEGEELAEGMYELLLAPPGASRTSAPRVDPELLEQLPLSGTDGRKHVHIGIAHQGPLVLAVERDLEDGERGGFAQRRLRTSHYPAARNGELRRAVLYESFEGRECSDSPRAIFEELVRREAPLKHLWVVDDGAFAAPEGSTAVRKGSREYYEAYARARYLIANDHWPRWFRRRRDQVAVQTWHGAPLKFQGRELVERPPAFREHRRALEMAEGWDRVVSPGPFASSILERCYEIDGDLLETGLPRTDLLLGPAAADRRAEIRNRLGVGEELVVLYAPTYRDSLDSRVGHRTRTLRDEPTYRLSYLDGYRLWEPLDLEALAAGLGVGHALLFYKHPRVVDATPPALTAAARDVSSYPDGLELLLAADVLVTDYSSWMFDFAATGRPIVLFAPDLEPYRDEVRGLHVDLEADGPGPVTRTTDEVVAALATPDAWRERREAFLKRYCPLSDGRAAGRLVERVFEW